MVEEGADKTAASRSPDLFLEMKAKARRAFDRAREWRKEAEEDYKFYNGNQWTDAERQFLRDQSRPALTFNRIGPLVNATVGAEISNRREVRYIPRELGDGIGNEILTGAAEWFRDLCDAEDEESEMFADAVICGMGWTETRLDFDENPDGEPVITRIDPFEMAWDPDCRKANLRGAKGIYRARKMDLSEAKEMFPEALEENLDATWLDKREDAEPHDRDKAKFYEDDGDEEEAGPKQVTIVECQYETREPIYRVAGPDGNLQTLDKEQFKQITAQMGGPPPNVRQSRKVMMRVFIGAVVLEGPSPVLGRTMPSYNCVTGYQDQDTGHWYGIVRPTKDPQRWANKWLSQIMHIMNSSAKGGVTVERGVFENDKDFEQSWARTDAVTFVADGALSNANGPKIVPKPMAQYPTGFAQLMEFAVSSLRDVTGINLELMGMREAQQAGVLEYQRRQAGMTMLAKLFDSLRRYRKAQGRLMLYLIQNHLSDGRLIRIVGDDKKQYVPLVRQADIEYDIIVDDAPSAPNEKEKTGQIIMSLMPQLQQMDLPPEMVAEIVRYLPLPASLSEKMADLIKKKAEEAAQNPETEEAKALQKAGAEAQVRKVSAEADRAAADAQKTGAEAAKLQSEALVSVIATAMGTTPPAAEPAQTT